MKKSILVSVLLAIIILSLSSAVSAESDMSRLNRERREVGRALLEMQSDNWPSLLEYYTNDIEYHDPIVSVAGIDMMSQFLGRLFVSTPDLVTTVEDEICVNGIYAATWTMDGLFNGVPYTAKGISIMKFIRKSTKVYYQRDYYSEGDIMNTIPGLDQAIIGFRTYYRCAVDPDFDCPLPPPAAAEVSEYGMTEEEDFRVFDKPMRKKSGPRSDKSRINQERQEIGRALVEIDSANWQSLLKYYADDIEYYDPIVSIEGVDMMTDFLGRLFIVSSPDLITTVEDEICIDGIYMATWRMDGSFNGIPYSAKGMSIVKFRPKETQAYYSRDYYTEGDIMSTIPGLDEAAEAFRVYYKCSVDPTFPCPF